MIGDASEGRDSETITMSGSFAHRQSTVLGILLVALASLSIACNVIDIVTGNKYYFLHSDEHNYGGLKLSNVSTGTVGHGFWCSALVSAVLFSVFTVNQYICKKTYQFKIHCKDDVMIALH